MAEEQEFYWDEETQTYYYWDEATQAYYPWVEDEGGVEEGIVETETSQTVEPAVERSFVEPVVIEPEPPPEPPPPAATTSDDAVGVSHSDEADSEFQRTGSSAFEGLRRRASSSFSASKSVAEHGGLAAALQAITGERSRRQSTILLSDEEIRLQAQKMRLRDMLAESGLADMQKLEKLEQADLGIVEPEPPPAEPEPPLANATVADIRTAAFGRGDRDARRRMSTVAGRRSTVRFGTTEFRDPSFQAKIDAMLGSSVKK